MKKKKIFVILLAVLILIIAAIFIIPQLKKGRDGNSVCSKKQHSSINADY